VVYLNVEMPLMKKVAADMIVGGNPVWFGCDVGQQMHPERGIWDARLFDLAAIYDTELGLDKAARLEYHQTLMTPRCSSPASTSSTAPTGHRSRASGGWRTPGVTNMPTRASRRRGSALVKRATVARSGPLSDGPAWSRRSGRVRAVR